jgi:DNA-binding transcriptional ArsR family regulator
MTRRLAHTDVFFAIADPTRRKILDRLGPGELSVNALAAEFDVTVSAVSQHLRLLREAGLVTVQRFGRERRYRLNPTPLRKVADWVDRYERFWQQKLAALGKHLENNP